MTPNSRFFVPDLSPSDRIALRKVKPNLVFVAESPHIHEIQPDELEQRRPLCGTAGKQWWGLLSEITEGCYSADVSLNHLIEYCRKTQITVMNAVQFPLDPKIAKYYSEADPLRNLGYSKASGPFSFKKLKRTPQVRKSIESLRERLDDPAIKDAKIYCLGNDALWFVSQALSNEEFEQRVGEKIPHPSAWWRQGGLFGRLAKEKLSKILGKEKVS